MLARAFKNWIGIRGVVQNRELPKPILECKEGTIRRNLGSIPAKNWMFPENKQEEQFI